MRLAGCLSSRETPATAIRGWARNSAAASRSVLMTSGIPPSSGAPAESKSVLRHLRSRTTPGTVADDGHRDLLLSAHPRRARGHRRLLACRQLPFGRPDLPARQPAAARAADARARQAEAARALGNDAGAEL